MLDDLLPPEERWRARLRLAIDRTGLKHSYIAELAGVDPTTLSRILNGRMQPRFVTVVRLAQAAKVSLPYLIDGMTGVTLSSFDCNILRSAAAIMLRIAPRQ